MGFLESTVWRLFNSPTRDPFIDKSPKLLAKPSQAPISRFSLPSHSSSSSSSTSSLSSSSTFWMSPKVPSRWSPTRYLPTSFRSAVSKRQIAVLICVVLALMVWVLPPPSSWSNHQVVHITISQPASSPYQVLRPVVQTTKKHAPDPLRWLAHNAQNRYAVQPGSNVVSTVPNFGQASSRPRAALISLVRNSELPGLVQSMRQLEFHWNRKYQYPWIFFNDEPFSDEFKVRRLCARVCFD